MALTYGVRDPRPNTPWTPEPSPPPRWSPGPRALPPDPRALSTSHTELQAAHLLPRLDPSASPGTPEPRPPPAWIPESTSLPDSAPWPTSPRYPRPRRVLALGTGRDHLGGLAGLQGPGYLWDLHPSPGVQEPQTEETRPVGPQRSRGHLSMREYGICRGGGPQTFAGTCNLHFRAGGGRGSGLRGRRASGVWREVDGALGSRRE